MRPHAALAESASLLLPPPLTARLRSQTRQAHDRIEANPKFSRLMAADLRREEYVALVARLFGHHAAAEAALAGAGQLLPPCIDLARRLRRTALLSGDLAALGMTPARIAALPRCPGIAIRQAEDAWGILYVLEGSSLGGQVIARHLALCLDLRADNGAAGMAPYGAETGLLWRGFKEALDDACLAGVLDAEAVIDAARDAFGRLDRWVELMPAAGAAWG